jgi:EpsI family protein
MTLDASRRKALVLFAAMGGTAALAVVAKPRHRIADDRAAVKLEAVFPERFGDWSVVPSAGALVRPADETGKLYGIYDQVLERVYLDRTGRAVMLSVAYGTEQSVGLQVHRPEVCYPGGGFKISRLERLSVPIGGQPLPVTRLLATHPGRTEPITYWTVLGDEVENDRRAFRWRQIASGLKGHILDGMLVRVSTLDTQPERAWDLQARFADDLVAAVPAALRERVVGKPVTP